MESICAIKDIYKALYQFEKTFAEVHDITINEAMLLCCLKDGETKSAGMICEYIGLSNSRVSKVITAGIKVISAATSTKTTNGRCASPSLLAEKKKYSR